MFGLAQGSPEYVRWQAEIEWCFAVVACLMLPFYLRSIRISQPEIPKACSASAV